MAKIKKAIPKLKKNIRHIADSMPDISSIQNMDIVGGIQDRKFHHFWDRHPVLSSVRALLFCTAGAALIAFVLNSFVNTVILYDGNYKDGTKTVTSAELEAVGLGSGFTASCVPKKRIPIWVSAFLRPLGWKGSYLFFLCICRIAFFVVY
jgi:hypothetical protein